MECVGTNNDFIGFAIISFKFRSVQHDIDENGMCLVKIDDFHPVFSESNRCICKYILDGGNEIANRGYLNGSYSKNIVLFIHHFIKG
jgi:hypothetical protein